MLGAKILVCVRNNGIQQLHLVLDWQSEVEALPCTDNTLQITWARSMEIVKRGTCRYTKKDKDGRYLCRWLARMNDKFQVFTQIIHMQHGRQHNTIQQPTVAPNKACIASNAVQSPTHRLQRSTLLTLLLLLAEQSTGIKRSWIRSMYATIGLAS